MFFSLFQNGAVAALFLGLGALFWIDWRSGLLPDRLLLPLAILGLMSAVIEPIGPLGLKDVLLGSVCGGAGLGLIRWSATRLLHREAMGLGDVKFMGMAGLWVGWQGLNAILVVGALTSILLAFLRHALTVSTRDRFHGTLEIPLGPGLCLGLGLMVALNAGGVQIGPAFWPL